DAIAALTPAAPARLRKVRRSTLTNAVRSLMVASQRSLTLAVHLRGYRGFRTIAEVFAKRHHRPSAAPTSGAPAATAASMATAPGWGGGSSSPGRGAGRSRSGGT